jgi:hypothetical protein
MKLQELQQEVLDASFRLHKSKLALRNARIATFESHKRYNIVSKKYQLALKEQEKIAYEAVVSGCATLACSARCIVRLR